jgi:hypothetical protein
MTWPRDNVWPMSWSARGARYAEPLAKNGQRDDMRRAQTELRERARIAPVRYRNAQKEWLEQAERLLGR